MKLISYKCSFCGEGAEFSSLEDNLGKTLKEQEFPYQLDDFETLSYKKYQCMKCGANDRDRLYKLYLDKYKPISKNTKIDIL